MIRKSFALALLLSGISCSGAILLTSIGFFEELQTALIVYLGFIMLGGGGFSLAFVVTIQDKIDHITKETNGCVEK